METRVHWRIQRPALGCKVFVGAPNLPRFSTFSADLGHFNFSMDAEPQPEPEPSEPAHFSRSRSRWSTVYLMDFHVLPYVLVMIKINGAGVVVGATRAGTICADPEPKPPEHFTRAGAGAGIVPRSRSRAKCGLFRMSDFYATKFLYYFYFDVLFFIRFGQVASSTLSRSDGPQSCCTNADALHARHFALWNHLTIGNTRIFLVTLPSLSWTRYRYLSCMCTAMPITWDWHRRSCAAGTKFCVLKSYNYKTGWILLIPNGPSFSLPRICHILVPISIQMKLLKETSHLRDFIIDSWKGVFALENQ